jgi:hypothetical protein
MRSAVALASGKGIHKTARECGVGVGTVQRIKRETASVYLLCSATKPRCRRRYNTGRFPSSCLPDGVSYPLLRAAERAHIDGSNPLCCTGWPQRNGVDEAHPPENSDGFKGQSRAS